MEHLVYADEYGLMGADFYWHRHEAKGISKEDILSVGLKDDRVLIHEDIVKPLLAADAAFQEKGFRLYLKEGYRSKELYEMIYKGRVKKFGKEETDNLLNMRVMPHASGKTVDITFWDEKGNREVYFRKGDDGVPALFVDFYKGNDDVEGNRYQELQEYMISVMQDLGFRLGAKREYFHFDYKPETQKNYP